MLSKSKFFAWGLFCSALFCTGSGLHAAWQPAETVSQPELYPVYEGNSLAVNFQGNAIAVWINQGDPVWGPFSTAVVSSFYTRGIGWAPFEYVSSLAPGPFGKLYGFVTNADVDMNSSNYAVAVWEGSYNDGVFPLPVFASIRPPGGPWGSVVPVSLLSDEFGNNINPAVHVNEAGTALMTWRVSNNPGRLNATLVSFLPLNGSWSSPFAVSSPTETNRDLDNSPGSALNSRGDAVVAWFGGNDNFDEINVATYDASTASWRPPVTLDSSPNAQSFPFYNPVSAIDENGNAVVIWSNANEVKTSYYPFGDVWEPSVTLATNGRSPPYVVMDPAGNSTALWDDFSGNILSASRPFGGAWSTPVIISQGGNDQMEIFLLQRDPMDVDQSGNVIAMWGENDSQQKFSAFKPFGQPWQAPELITARQSSFYNIGLAECGFAVASWIGSEDGIPVIEAAVNDSVFPLIVSGSATFTHCKQQFATQKRYISFLSWVPVSADCISAYNIFCNGKLVATTTDTNITIPGCGRTPCNFTITTVNVSGTESDPIPFVLVN